MIDVSVIIAAWNAEATLARCIASVLAQTGATIEVIVVDDCSTDTTATLIARLGQVDSAIVPARTPVNSGPGAARNLGLNLARGTWVAILDADDELLPGRLAAMVDEATSRDLDVCFDNLLMIEAGARRPLVSDREARRLAANWTVEMYAAANRPYRSKLLTGFLKPLIRRAFLQSHGLAYDPLLRNSEDYLLVLECLCARARVGYLHRPLYAYHVHGGSLSGRFDADAHRRFLDAETALLARLHDQISARAARAIHEHIAAYRAAGVTNAIFGQLRERRFVAAIAALAADPLTAPVHVSRIVRAAARRLLAVRTRGR